MLVIIGLEPAVAKWGLMHGSVRLCSQGGRAMMTDSFSSTSHRDGLHGQGHEKLCLKTLIQKQMVPSSQDARPFNTG